MKFRTFSLRRDPECAVCGDRPVVTELVDYEGFCGIPPVGKVSDEMTVQELEVMMRRGEDFFLLDVRESFESDIARIEGATLIPLGQLAGRLDEIPRGLKIAVHCKSGGRSARAVSFLREAGFEEARNVAGGITAWSREIDPTVPIY
jgi:adenylyltransferase/sulfurtransferase